MLEDGGGVAVKSAVTAVWSSRRRSLHLESQDAGRLQVMMMNCQATNIPNIGCDRGLPAKRRVWSTA